MKYVYILKYICLIQAQYLFNVKEQGYVGTVNKEIFPSIVSDISNAIDFLLKIVDANKNEFVIQKVNESNVFDIYGGLKKNSTTDQKLNLYTLHNGTNQRFQIINPATGEAAAKDNIYNDTEYNIVIGNKCLYVKHEDKRIYLGNCDDNKLESAFIITQQTNQVTNNISPAANKLTSNVPTQIDIQENKPLSLVQNNYKQQIDTNVESIYVNRDIATRTRANDNTLQRYNNNYKKVNTTNAPAVVISDVHPDKIVVPTTEVHNITYTEVKDPITLNKIQEPTKTREPVFQTPVETVIQPMIMKNVSTVPQVNAGTNSRQVRTKATQNIAKEVDNNNDLDYEEESYNPEYEVSKSITNRRIKSLDKYFTDDESVRRYPRNYKISREDIENMKKKYNIDRKKAEYYKKKYDIKDEDIEYFKKNHKNITLEDIKKYSDKKLAHLSPERRADLKKKIQDNMHSKTYKAKLVTEKPVKVKVLKNNKKNDDESDTENDETITENEYSKKQKVKKTAKRTKGVDSKRNKPTKSSADFFD